MLIVKNLSPNNQWSSFKCYNKCRTCGWSVLPSAMLSINHWNPHIYCSPLAFKHDVRCNWITSAVQNVQITYRFPFRQEWNVHRWRLRGQSCAKMGWDLTLCKVLFRISRVWRIYVVLKLIIPIFYFFSNKDNGVIFVFFLYFNTPSSVFTHFNFASKFSEIWEVNIELSHSKI